MAGKKDGEFVTFKFPIIDSGRVAPMKRIPPHVLPNFHGLENEDLDVFYLNLNYFEEYIIVLMIKI